MTAFRDWLGGIPEWHELALCREVDGELFFPEKGESTADAKKVCKLCDVQTECLEDALAGLERFGVWGGKSGNERRKILHDRGVQLSADLGGVA